MSHRLFALVLAAVVVPGWGIAQTGPDPARAPAELEQLEAWWSDLEGEDAVAVRALLRMADRPAAAVGFLKEKLKPLKLDAVKLKAYLLRLGSDNETLWRQAFADLEYYDPRVAMDLVTLMDRVTESPTRQRLVEVLCGREPGSLKGKTIELKKFDNFFNFLSDNTTWWAEPDVSQLNARAWTADKRKWKRAVRAMVLLEHIHTSEAVAILRDMATGHPDAQPTRVAKEALKRLEQPATGGPKAADTGRRP